MPREPTPRCPWPGLASVAHDRTSRSGAWRPPTRVPRGQRASTPGGPARSHPWRCRGRRVLRSTPDATDARAVARCWVPSRGAASRGGGRPASLRAHRFGDSRTRPPLDGASSPQPRLADTSHQIRTLQVLEGGARGRWRGTHSRCHGPRRREPARCPHERGHHQQLGSGEACREGRWNHPMSGGQLLDGGGSQTPPAARIAFSVSQPSATPGQHPRGPVSGATSVGDARVTFREEEMVPWGSAHRVGCWGRSHHLCPRLPELEGCAREWIDGLCRLRHGQGRAGRVFSEVWQWGTVRSFAGCVLGRARQLGAGGGQTARASRARARS